VPFCEPGSKSSGLKNYGEFDKELPAPEGGFYSMELQIVEEVATDLDVTMHCCSLATLL
jgi:hypothetical protein